MAEMTNPGGGAAMSPAPACPNGRLYTVKPGDSMFTIARQSNIPLAALIAANPQIADPNMIFPGQRICVPCASPPGPVCSVNYTVQSGDSMYSIATRYGITLDALKAANPQIVNPDLIFPGQIICVPVVRPPVPLPPAACPNGTLYTVRSGDTMFDIATRFGITLQALLAANPQIVDASRIFPGQPVCIPALTMGPVPPPPVAISPAVWPLMPAIPAVPTIPPMPWLPVTPAMPVMPTCPIELPAPVYPVSPVMPAVPVMPYPSMMPQCPLPCPMMAPIVIDPLCKRHHHHHHNQGKKRLKYLCMRPAR